MSHSNTLLTTEKPFIIKQYQNVSYLFRIGWNGGRFVAEYKQFFLNQTLLPDYGTRACEDMDFSRNNFHSTNYPLPYYGQDRCKFWVRFNDENMTAVKVLFTKIDTNTPYLGSGMCHWTDENDYVEVKSECCPSFIFLLDNVFLSAKTDKVST